MSEDEKLARSRFMVLNLVRLIGLALILLGIAVHFGKVPLPEPAAYIFIAMGFAEFFFMPNFLAKRWRSDDL